MRLEVKAVRVPLIAGNWKMNGSLAAGEALLSRIWAALPLPGVEVAVMPPFPYIDRFVRAFGGKIAFGAQDVSAHEKDGAHTGEVSARMLAEVGCRYVIVGHSERRRDHGESDELVWRKAEAASAAGMTPILCVGERLEERERGLTEQVIARQLAPLNERRKVLERLCIAYEPVWAIGTGVSASAEQVASVHALIRGICAELDARMANSLRILYGGSVKATNAASLLAAEGVDGALVGGASLDAEEFLAVARAAAQRLFPAGERC